MFLENKEIPAAIKRAIANSRNADLAVAYWGKGATRELGLNKIRRKKIRIICDLLSGGTNPTEIKMMCERFPGKVRHIPGLHAKVYLTDKVCIVGSSNASANGLGNEGGDLGLIEAAYLSDISNDVHVASQWFERQWEMSLRISATDLKKADLAWQQRKKARPPINQAHRSAASKELFGVRIQDLADRKIFVVVYQEGISKEGRSVVRSSIKKRPSFYNYGYYEEDPPKGKGWVPLNSYVVDCYVYPKTGSVTVQRRFWATWEDYQADPISYEDGQRGYIMWMRPQKKIQIGSKEISISKGDVRKIAQAVKRIRGYKTQSKLVPIEKLKF